MPPKTLVKTELFEDDEEDDMFKEAPKVETRPVKLPNLQSILEDQIKSAAEFQEDVEKPWLRQNLLVKCVNMQLASGKYYKRVGRIDRLVEGGWGAEVTMLNSQDILLLDQEDCETTLPKIGGPVLVVSGQYVGSSGAFVELSPDGKDAVVEIQRRRVALPLGSFCAKSIDGKSINGRG